MTEPHEHTLWCGHPGCVANIHITGEAISSKMTDTVWTIRTPARCTNGHDLWIVVENTWSEWPTTVTVTSQKNEE